MNARILAYGVLAAVGLAWPLWHLVPAFVADHRGAFPAAFARAFSADPVSGLTADLLVITTGALIWLFAEAVRLRMRWPVYLALTLTTPFAFVFALFLLRREQVLART